MAATAFLWDPRYAAHDTMDHPEGPDRVDRISDHLRGTDLWERLTELSPSPAPESELLRIHTPGHIERIRRASLVRGGEWIDADTYVSAQSYEIALLAVGGTEQATDRWVDGLVTFAAVRPPGHHAMPDQAMGFCLFNNVAIAAARLMVLGYERIAIIDWDAHHGNGTEAAFMAVPEVLYVSLHQWPLYPGTGWLDEVGVGDAEGKTVNLPLPPGSGDADGEHAFETLIEPIVDQFRPQAVLVSAGFDGHRSDPLASLKFTEAGFGAMALRCLRLAQRHCDGKMALVLEGGYERKATARSVEAVLRAIGDEQAPAVDGGKLHAAEVIDRLRGVQSRYWDL